MFAVERAQALNGLERTSEAADVLLEVLVDQGVIDVHLGSLVETCAAPTDPSTSWPAPSPRRRPRSSWPNCSI